jgi:hypothetical protein
MSKPILTVVAILASQVAVAGFSGTASASQSGLTGSPWIDQYIEQVPTAGGGKPVDHSGGPRTGLTRSEVSALAQAGGDTFAGATAASVVPIATQFRDSKSSSDSGKPTGANRSAHGAKSVTDQVEAAALPSVSATLIQSASGGDGGLGPVLPAALIGSLIGAVALGASRLRRPNS